MFIGQVMMLHLGPYKMYERYRGVHRWDPPTERELMR
jgi:hypothetical protein